MASNTERLDLYKKDPSIDGNDTFNLETMMNDNWDKIDEKVATKVDFDSHAEDNTKHITTTERTSWNNKVDKAVGKGLSTEDYTTVEKSKLSSIENNANNYTHPSTHPPSIISQDATNRFVSDSEKSTWNGKAETKADVGLGSVQNYGVATQTESETGTSNTKYMTPQRTKQAIEALSPEGITEQDVDSKISSHSGSKSAHGLSDSSVAIGSSAAVGSNGVAVGRLSRALGVSSTAIGNQTYAATSNSLVLGFNSQANAVSSIAIGHSAKTEPAMNSSTAIGHNANAGGFGSIALGANSKVLNDSTGVLGVPSGTGASSWTVPGSFTVEGTKNFEMPHPHPDKKETHRLRHSAVESPTAGDNLYRFEIEATEALQEVELELPDYFQYLNKDVDVWVNGIDHFGNAYGKIEGNTLKVNCEYAGKYNVLVIGTRNDEHQSVQDWDIMGVEREIGESWTGETYVFEVDEILEIEEIKEEDVA